MNRTFQLVILIAASTLNPVTSQAEPGALMYASDVLRKPLTAVTLAIGLDEFSSSAGRGQPIEGRRVDFLLVALNGQTLNNPMQIGTTRTDAGGRAYQEWIPEWGDEKGSETRYEVEARLSDSLEPIAAPVRILVLTLPDDRPVLLLKLDAEPTTPGGARSSAREPTDTYGSRVFDKLSERYQFVYLTDVEVRAANAFKGWMRRRDLPGGPLMLLDESTVEIPNGERTARYVKDLVNRYPQIAVGIGGTIADARAFTSNNLTAIVVPGDLDGWDKIPDDMLVTSSWKTALVHIRLCDMSAELLRIYEIGGVDARNAEQQLEQLGLAGIACIDRVARDASLRSAAIYMSGRIRAIHAFRTMVVWNTSLELRDSLLAAWRFGAPSVIRDLYAEPTHYKAIPIPKYERWEPVGTPPAHGAVNVVHTVRLIGKDGRAQIREITCEQQADLTWRVLTVDSV